LRGQLFGKVSFDAAAMVGASCGREGVSVELEDG
jgi:hypothetical protein